MNSRFAYLQSGPVCIKVRTLLNFPCIVPMMILTFEYEHDFVGLHLALDTMNKRMNYSSKLRMVQ